MFGEIAQEMRDHLSLLPWGDWLSHRRWFVRTGIRQDAFLDTIVLIGTTVVCFVSVGDDLYFVPITIGEEGTKDAMVDSDGHAWIDALEDTDGVQELMDLCLDRPQGPKWTKIHSRVLDRAGLEGSRRGKVRTGTADQTNSWALCGDSFLKVYRRLDFSRNLDVEVLEALADRQDLSVPRLRAVLEVDRRGEVAALMVVQQAIPHDCNAWDSACAEVEGAAAGKYTDPRGWQLLGRRVAELHAAMAETFGIEFQTEEKRARFGASAEALSRDVLEELAAKGRNGWDAATLRQADDLLSRGDSLAALFANEAPAGLVLQRVHGDLHLGQILSRDGDWTIIDFEGEPARPAFERAAKAHPAKDVSGMLRSFDYASRGGLPAEASEHDGERACAWRDAARVAFLEGYFAHPPVAALWPADPAARSWLLAFHEAEKAVYELRYELRHRPDWLAIPLGGLRALIG